MNKNHFKKILPYLLLIVFVAIIWPRDPQVEAESVNDQSSKVSKSVVTKPQLREPDRSPKFLKLEDIKIKRKLAEKESEHLVKKVLAPPLSKELQDELGDAKKNGYGAIPAIDMKENLNPQKLSVIEAIKSGSHSERLSIMGKREKFDYEKYKQNPREYLDVVIPSRPYDTAQPGKGVKRLTRVTSEYVETYQGETVELTVTGMEGSAPLSATVYDGGKFSNDLSAITVQADASGTATIRFTSTEGVIQNTRILLGSPLSSGSVRFNVYVKKKREKVQ